MKKWFPVLIAVLIACTGLASAFAEVEITPDPKYFDDNGNMILPLVDEETTFRVFWRKQTSDVGTIQDKVILQKAMEETGIKLVIEEISDAGWNEKMAVVFASGNLPDLICGDIPNLINFTDQCTDVTDLLPTYAPFMADFYFNKYPAVAKAEAFEGRMFSMPEVRVNNLYYFNGWEINKRWIDNLGLQTPSTPDELYEVLKAFKEKDANGNGDSNDEIPFTFVGVMDTTCPNDGLLTMMNMFGMVNDGVNNLEQYIMVENGKVIFTAADQRFYDMLVFLNKLYREGLMDVDGFVQTVNEAYAKTAADKVGFRTHGGLVTEAWGGDMAANVEYILPPASEYGAKIRRSDPPAEMRLHTYTITTACKHPELLVLFAEYCNSTAENRWLSLFGPEGGAWKYNEDGKIINQTDFTGKPYTTVAQARATLAPNYRFPTIILEEEEGKRLYTGNSLYYNTTHKEMYGPEGGVSYEETFPRGNDTAENSEIRNELFTEINNYMQTFVAESVMNGIDEAGWQKHLKALQTLDTDSYVRGFQELYETLR